MFNDKYKIVVKRNNDGKFNWTLVSRKNGRTLSTANQGYSRKIDAINQANGIARDLCGSADVPTEVVDATGTK